MAPPTPFANMLDAMTKQRGVTAALVVSERDGIVVDSNLQIGQDGDKVAALAASLYRKARLSARAAGMGGVSFMQLEAPGGRICAIGGGELVLIVVAEAAVNVGLVRVELLKAVPTLAALGGEVGGSAGARA
jgi:predicted regulator of Ras-like GTPase activity (Roadblock/LC7/MglB family)